MKYCLPDITVTVINRRGIRVIEHVQEMTNIMIFVRNSHGRRLLSTLYTDCTIILKGIFEKHNVKKAGFK